MSKYWMVSGELAVTLNDMLERRGAAIKEMFAFAKRFGSNEVAIYLNGLMVHFSVMFAADKVPEGWKSAVDGYIPRKNTRGGRALTIEMQDICIDCPSGFDIADAVGMNIFTDDEMRTPSLTKVEGAQLVMALPHDFVPSEELAGCFTRISDIEFEKFIEPILQKAKEEEARKYHEQLNAQANAGWDPSPASIEERLENETPVPWDLDGEKD